MDTYILRLEQADGCGVYRDNFLANCGVLDDAIWHPTPWQDNLSHFKKGIHYFGFAGLRTYLQWFYDPAWRNALTEAGAKLCVYVVKSVYVRKGEHQIIFTKAHAQLLNKFPPNIFDAPDWQTRHPKLAQVIDHAN